MLGVCTSGNTSLLNTGRVVCFQHSSTSRFLTTSHPPTSLFEQISKIAGTTPGTEACFDRKVEKLTHIQFRVRVKEPTEKKNDGEEPSYKFQSLSAMNGGEEPSYAFQSLSTGLWLCKTWESRALRIQSKTPYYFRIRTADPSLWNQHGWGGYGGGGAGLELEALHIMLFATENCLSSAGEWVMFKDGRLRGE